MEAEEGWLTLSRVDIFYLMMLFPSSVNISISILLFYCISFFFLAPQICCENNEIQINLPMNLLSDS